MTDATISKKKKALRARMLKARDAIDPERRLEVAQSIEGHLRELPAYRDAEGVGGYFSTGSQVPMAALLVDVVEVEGRRSYLPFYLNGRLEMTEWMPTAPVVEGEYVGLHPRYRQSASLEEIGVVLVPGLAFDRRGHRLGSGEGLYDRLLARFPADSVTIGVAYGAQLVDALPFEEGDVVLDFVVTEDGALACSDRFVTASDQMS